MLSHVVHIDKYVQSFRDFALVRLCTKYTVIMDIVYKELMDRGNTSL